MRDKVLRRALEREAEAFTRPELGRAALIPANYTFVEPGSVIPQDGLLSVLVEPRRKDSVLVRGRIFLTPDGADLVRIEGQLAKPPSFWTRRVDVVRRYERIDNVRVPVALESEAQILVAGRSSFRMIYEYAAINGREIGQPQPRRSEVALTADAEPRVGYRAGGRSSHSLRHPAGALTGLHRAAKPGTSGRDARYPEPNGLVSG